VKKSAISAAVLPMAATVVVLMSAPDAGATGDGSFLDELSTNHVSLPGKTSAEVVAAGYATCNHLRSGTSVLDEMDAVEKAYHMDQGTLFVSAATTHLCPDAASH
jgi:hypothetical protein